MTPATLFCALFLAAGPPLSLDGAFQLAERGAPALQSARLEVPVAEAQVDVAKGFENPALTFSVGPDEPTISGAVEQRLSFINRGSAVRVAEAERSIAALRVPAARAHLHADIRRAYAKTAALQERLRVAEDIASLGAQSAKAAQLRFQTGAGSELDALRATLAQQRQAQDATDRRAELQGARIELAIALGIRPDEFGELTDTPLTLATALAAQQAPSAGPQGSTEHPDVAVVSAEREAANARAHAERMKRWPVPIVSLELERLNGPPVYPGVRGTITFDVPVFNWNAGAVRAEELRAAQKDAERIATERKLDAQAASARAHLTAAVAKAALYAQTLLPQARRVVEMSQLAYEAGKEPLQTVLQSQLDFADVRDQAIAAAEDAQVAYADLEEAMGVGR